MWIAMTAYGLELVAIVLAVVAIAIGALRRRNGTGSSSVRSLVRSVRQLQERVVGLEVQNELQGEDIEALHELITRVGRIENRLADLDGSVAQLRREQTITHDRLRRHWVAQQVTVETLKDQKAENEATHGHDER